MEPQIRVVNGQRYGNQQKQAQAAKEYHYSLSSLALPIRLKLYNRIHSHFQPSN